VTSGIERIAAERTRQIEEEHYDAAHDDEHGIGELSVAAACYAAGASGERIYRMETFAAAVRFVDPWPWSDGDDRRPYDLNEGTLLADPTDEQAIRLLEKAGALIAAEIDRILRSKKKSRKRS
jgi:hypothetical protein